VLLLLLLRFSAQLTGASYYSTSWYLYSVLKKVPEYRYPLYCSMGIGLKKLFLSIDFTILKKSYFWNIQPVPAPYVSRTKKSTSPPRILFGRRRVRHGVRGAGRFFECKSLLLPVTHRHFQSNGTPLMGFLAFLADSE
jgi:hypothetical protein